MAKEIISLRAFDSFAKPAIAILATLIIVTCTPEE
jgi:hypothetical protein